MKPLVKAPANWAEWSMMFNDEHIWLPLLREICIRTGISIPIPIEAGFPGTCAVFITDRKFVIKVFPPFLPSDYLHELGAYRLLGDRLGPFLPGMIAYGIVEDEIRWPYLVLEYREGAPIRDIIDAIPPYDLDSIGDKLGGILRCLHTTPILSGDSSFDVSEESWQDFIQDRRAHCRLEIEQKTNFSSRLLDSIEKFVHTYPIISDTNERLRLLNGDLTEDHLLLIRRDDHWQIDALIDWADSMVGTVEYEWIPLWFGLCQRKFDFFSSIMRSYDPSLVIDEHFQERMTAYTFIHRFGADIIAYWLRRQKPKTIDTLPEMKDWLWPRKNTSY